MILAFAGVAAVVIATPGPDTALVLRNVLWGGRRAGLATAAGVVTGQAVWAVAATFGVAAIIRASEPALLALRIGGGLYLAWLGLSSLRAAWRGHREPAALPAAGRSYRQGLLGNLANPKMGVFFLTLLPQFATRPMAMLGLGALFVAMTYAWLALVAGGAARLSRRLRRGLDLVTGVVLLGLGARLVSD